MPLIGHSPINHFGYSLISPSTAYFIMPMSARTIPGTQDQYGRGRATVRVHGQTGNCTNASRAITPFMFNEEEYRVSDWFQVLITCTEGFVVCL